MESLRPARLVAALSAAAVVLLGACSTRSSQVEERSWS